MSDGGRSQKPPGQVGAPKPAPDAQKAGVAPTAPASASANDRIAASLSERRQAASEVTYRASGGQQGSAPMARIMGNARAATNAAVGRWMRKASGPAGSAATLPRSGGPLPADVRTKMESKLGADLSRVTVSTSSESAGAAARLGARAFTVGQDVHFGAGQWNPNTVEGKRLIAHELTHTVQAGSGLHRKADEGESAAEAAGQGGQGAEVSDPDEPAEKEADAVADQVVANDDGEASGAKTPDKKKQERGKGKQGAEARGAEAAEGEAEVDGAEAEGAEASGAGTGAEAGSEAGPDESGAEAAGTSSGGAQASDGAEAAPKEKPATISAKLEGVGLKILRSATPPGPGPAPPTPGPSPPADDWQTFVDRLPGDLKGLAAAISDPEEQVAFKPLLPSEQRSFCQLTGKPVRLEFAGLPGRAKANVAVLLLEADSKRLYETLPSNLRAVWRDLTPDERIDLLKGGDAKVTQLLTDAPSLDRWRQNRNVEALKTQPRLAQDLAVPGGETPEKIVEGLSVGEAGERLRRIMVDTSFAAEATKSQFILETWGLVKGGKTPIDAMWSLQPRYALKGKESKNDAKWNDIPLLKAIPTKWIGKYGTLGAADLVACLETAPKTDTRIPRKGDGSVDQAQALAKNREASFRDTVVGEYYPAFAKASGLDATRIDYTIQGRGTPAAYWMAAADGMQIVTKKEAEIAKILAVDESPDYATGFAIVRMDETTKKEWVQSQGNITRPTAIDALGFNQFAINPDADECLGVTSGGMKEAVIRSVPINRTSVVKQP